MLLHILLTLEEPIDVFAIKGLLARGQEGGRQSEAAAYVNEQVATSLGADARALVCSLLTLDPGERLGTTGGAAEVQAHPFFKSVDWKLLEALKLPPPLLDPVAELRGVG